MTVFGGLCLSAPLFFGIYLFPALVFITALHLFLLGCGVTVSGWSYAAIGFLLIGAPLAISIMFNFLANYLTNGSKEAQLLPIFAGVLTVWLGLGIGQIEAVFEAGSRISTLEPDNLQLLKGTLYSLGGVIRSACWGALALTSIVFMVELVVQLILRAGKYRGVFPIVAIRQLITISVVAVSLQVVIEYFDSNVSIGQILTDLIP